MSVQCIYTDTTYTLIHAHIHKHTRARMYTHWLYSYHFGFLALDLFTENQLHNTNAWQGTVSKLNFDPQPCNCVTKEFSFHLTDYELSTLSKNASTSEGTQLTSVTSSDPESEMPVSKVPLKGEKNVSTSFANPLAEKIPLSADDEVIANPVTNEGPEETTQTEITMEAASQQKVENSPSLEKEIVP